MRRCYDCVVTYAKNIRLISQQICWYGQQICWSSGLIHGRLSISLTRGHQQYIGHVMKSGLWCEIVVSGILLSTWIPPVYASCVQCLPTEQNPFPVVTTADQLAPVSVTLSSSSSVGVEIPGLGLQMLDRPALQPIQPIAHPAAIQFVPSTTDLARPVVPPSPIAAPVLILPERGIGQGRTPLASRTRSQHRAANPEPSQSLLAQAVLVTNVVVTGNTAVSDAEIAAITSKLLGKSVDFAALQAVADEITQVYLDRGYITSRAILPEQAIVGGVVPIQVIEGGLERIDIEALTTFEDVLPWAVPYLCAKIGWKINCDCCDRIPCLKMSRLA